MLVNGRATALEASAVIVTLPFGAHGGSIAGSAEGALIPQDVKLRTVAPERNIARLWFGWL